MTDVSFAGRQPPPTAVLREGGFIETMNPSYGAGIHGLVPASTARMASNARARSASRSDGGPAAIGRASSGSRAHDCCTGFLLMLLGIPLWIMFAVVYVPFIFAILLQSLVRRQPVDPAHWRTDVSRPVALAAVVVFLVAVTWCFVCPLLVVPAGNTLQWWLSPSIIFAVLFQLLTYDYANQRPELSMVQLKASNSSKGQRRGEDKADLADIEEEAGRNPCQQSTRDNRKCCPGSRFRWTNWRNWLVVSVVFFENAQFNATLISGAVPWLNTTAPFNATACALSIGSGGSASSPPSSMPNVSDIYAGNHTHSDLSGGGGGGGGQADGMWEDVWQQIIGSFLFLQSAEVSFVLAMALVGTYAVILGIFIEQERGATDPLAPVLFEFLSGTLFITAVGSLLRVARSTTNKAQQVCILLAFLYYSTTSIFVSVYRGDQIVLKSDVAHTPRFMIVERSLKAVFSFFAVYAFSCRPLAQVLTVTTTELLLLAALSGMVHPCTCAGVQRLRQVLLAMSIWVSVTAALNFATEPTFFPWYIASFAGDGAIVVVALVVFAVRFRWCQRPRGK